MIEILEHTADIGFKIHAPDLPNLFQEAGIALFSLIIEKTSEPVSQVNKCISIPFKGDYETLLFDWLNELLFDFETQHCVFHTFNVKISTTELSGTVIGEPFDPSKHLPFHEVKAITYHDLLVRQSEDGSWEARVIVDI